MGSRFSGKSVLVAGGTGGLGRAVSLAFLGESAKVEVTYQKEDEFAALKSVAGGAASLQGHNVDVTADSAVREVVKNIVDRNGRLDVLVDAVGAYAGGTALWQTEPAVFERMLNVNLRSGYMLCRAVTPAMLKQKSGAIVSVSSRAAVDHAAGGGAYAASKAGSIALMDSLAADLKGSGVRVNSVLPSIIDTEANRKAMPNADFTKWPKAEDIARVILFLCSDDAKLIHGASIPVYGDT